jgi:hypothetical protein
VAELGHVLVGERGLQATDDGELYNMDLEARFVGARTVATVPGSGRPGSSGERA